MAKTIIKTRLASVCERVWWLRNRLGSACRPASCRWILCGRPLRERFPWSRWSRSRVSIQFSHLEWSARARWLHSDWKLPTTSLRRWRCSGRKRRWYATCKDTLGFRNSACDDSSVDFWSDDESSNDANVSSTFSIFFWLTSLIDGCEKTTTKSCSMMIYFACV